MNSMQKRASDRKKRNQVDFTASLAYEGTKHSTKMSDTMGGKSVLLDGGNTPMNIRNSNHDGFASTLDNPY